MLSCLVVATVNVVVFRLCCFMAAEMGKRIVQHNAHHGMSDWPMETSRQNILVDLPKRSKNWKIFKYCTLR